jgi:hypothetical protein
LRAIRGIHSGAFARLLGHESYGEGIGRDDLEMVR